MKNKTIQFKLSPEFCIRKAESYYDEGDYVLALSYLDRVKDEKLSSELFEDYCFLRAQICHVFGTESGNFWALKYYAENGYSERLAPMIAYTTIENDKLLNEFKDEDLPDFLQELMSTLEGIDGISGVEGIEMEDDGEENADFMASLGVKKPERKLMFTRNMIGEKAVSKGEKLMKASKFEQAISAYREVPIASDKYCEALSGIALCHLFLGNYKKSYEINKMVLASYPDYLQSLLQMMSLCNILEKTEEFKVYMEIVLAKKHNPTDSVKVANILIDAREYERAIPYFEYAFDNLNYSLEGYVTYILTLYNAGKCERGKIEMKEILKFCPDNAVLWWLLSQMDGREYVSYEPLFAEVVDVCVEKGVRIAGSGKLSEETFTNWKKVAYLKYACGKSNKAIEHFDRILSFKNGEKMFCELLYHPITSSVQRANVLRYLMKNGFKGKVLFRGATYKYLKISYPACALDSQSMFIAYAFAFSTLAYFQSDFEPMLKRSMTAFVKACDKNEIDFENLMTPDMISALVVAKLKKLSFEMICDFASVDKKKFLYMGILVYGEKFREWNGE
ncbi:MAG: hypothetical protein R3Y65_08130 [Bacillota bacterium]